MNSLRNHLRELAKKATPSKGYGGMEVTTPYLEKRALFPAQITAQPVDDLELIVVIPAKDEKHLLKSLASLHKAKQPDCSVEIIVVINDSEKDDGEMEQRNSRLFQRSIKWASEHSTSEKKFHILYHSGLPAKHAGVGLARKIGMDEAVYRFAQIEKENGLIVCFDADTLCQRNYFTAIQQYFFVKPKLQAAGIYYEHPLEGEEFPKMVYRAIALYELHLRYYTHAQRFAGFPFACETIGSAMVVRADAYQQQGGMNKRKAGEDFYFLHKFTPLGHFGEIKSTIVKPSPRRSDRVPFGTGKAVASFTENRKEEVQTYAPQSFEDLKLFFERVPHLRKWKTEKAEELLKPLPESIQAFLKTVDVNKSLSEITKNTTNAKTFENRFFRWFNAFMIMKYVHFARDKFYPNVKVEEAAQWLLKIHFKKRLRGKQTAPSLLLKLRKEDKKATDFFD
ncbi:MAG: glycosyltransferase family A protein [Saprospiraceae bacterium]